MLVKTLIVYTYEHYDVLDHETTNYYEICDEHNKVLLKQTSDEKEVMSFIRKQEEVKITFKNKMRR